MLRLLALLLLLISFPVPAGKNTPHDPSKFAQYESVAYFEVANDVKYTERRGIGYRWEQGLKSGKYEATSQDGDGYYFVGPSSAVCQVSPKCADFDKEGGIWVSKESSSDIRLFIIQNRTAEEKLAARHFGPIISALANSDDGKIFIFPKNASFAGEMASYLKQ